MVTVQILVQWKYDWSIIFLDKSLFGLLHYDLLKFLGLIVFQNTLKLSEVSHYSQLFEVMEKNIPLAFLSVQ